jgi:hypothetical protein
LLLFKSVAKNLFLGIKLHVDRKIILKQILKKNGRFMWLRKGTNRGLFLKKL